MTSKKIITFVFVGICAWQNVTATQPALQSLYNDINTIEYELNTIFQQPLINDKIYIAQTLASINNFIQNAQRIIASISPEIFQHVLDNIATIIHSPETKPEKIINDLAIWFELPPITIIHSKLFITLIAALVSTIDQQNPKTPQQYAVLSKEIMEILKTTANNIKQSPYYLETNPAEHNKKIQRVIFIVLLLLLIGTSTALFVSLFHHMHKIEKNAQQCAEQLLIQERLIEQCQLQERVQEQLSLRINLLQTNSIHQQETLTHQINQTEHQLSQELRHIIDKTAEQIAALDATMQKSIQENTATLNRQRQDFLTFTARTSTNFNTVIRQFNAYLAQMGSYASEIDSQESLFKRSTSWLGAVLPGSLQTLSNIAQCAGTVAAAGSSLSSIASAAKTLMPQPELQGPSKGDLQQRLEALRS